MRNATLLILAIFTTAIGCNSADSANAPSLSYRALTKEINGGKATLVHIQKDAVVAEFTETPAEIAATGQGGTKFQVKLPNNSSARAQLVSLCAKQHVRVVQY